MASIYDLKPRFQNLLRPITTRLAAAGVTPNQITVAAILLSVTGGAAIALFPDRHFPLYCVPVVLLLRMALNAIDGMLAREHDMQTAAGAFLNEIGDVVSDAALYLPFALIPGVPVALMVAIVMLAVISEMTGVVGVQVGGSRRYDGPMGKSDRAFLFGLLGLLLAAGLEPGPWLSFACYAVIALLSLTILNRGRRAVQEVT